MQSFCCLYTKHILINIFHYLKCVFACKLFWGLINNKYFKSLTHSQLETKTHLLQIIKKMYVYYCIILLWRILYLEKF